MGVSNVMRRFLGKNDDSRENQRLREGYSAQGSQGGDIGSDMFTDDDDSLLESIPTISDADDNNDLETPERQAQLSLIAKLSTDLDEFEKNISQNEFHLRHTREKLAHFKSFVQHADVEFDEIHRLRKQKVQLSKDLASEEALNKELRRAFDVEKANVTAVRNRMAEYRAVLEDARKEIISLGERDMKHRERIDDLSAAVSKREIQLQELTSSSERLAAEIQVLKESNERANVTLNKYKETATTLGKKVDDLTEKESSAHDEIDRLTASLTVTTESLDNYQAENVHLQSQLDNALAENKALEKRVNDKVRIREEELFSLRSRIDGLQSELKIKEQLLSQASDDVKQARHGQEAAESAAKGLTEQLAREVKQREEYRDRLTESNKEIAQVNERFNALIGELEQSRRENLVLQRMLKAERQKLELAANSVPGSQMSAEEQKLMLDEVDESSQPN